MPGRARVAHPSLAKARPPAYKAPASPVAFESAALMKLAVAFAALLLAVANPVWAAPAKAAKASAPAHVALPTDVTPERYDIAITPDAKDLTFLGHEAITIVVKRPTARIVLNAADITFWRLQLSCSPQAPQVTLDKAQQTATFTFAKPIAPGRYTLAIDYAGVIYAQASGFFALDYAGAQGKQRALFTQFHTSDARRFPPMCDEPRVKSVFALSVDTPDGQIAVSHIRA